MPTPSPKKKTEEFFKIPELDFPDAMREVIAGNKVTKLSWNNPKVYLYLDTHLCIHNDDGTIHTLIVHVNDMLGKDWIVL